MQRYPNWQFLNNLINKNTQKFNMFKVIKTVNICIHDILKNFYSLLLYLISMHIKISENKDEKYLEL